MATNKPLYNSLIFELNESTNTQQLTVKYFNINAFNVDKVTNEIQSRTVWIQWPKANAREIEARW